MNQQFSSKSDRLSEEDRFFVGRGIGTEFGLFFHPTFQFIFELDSTLTTM